MSEADKIPEILDLIDRTLEEYEASKIGKVAITGHYAQNIINKVGGFGGVEDVETELL